MAGYIIHISVGEEYIRLHPNEIKNHEEFISGIIYPDSVADKSLTHCGPKSSKVNLSNFFKDKDIDTDFNKGYFLHLVADYLFYNKFLKVFSKNIYNDYDILNRELEKIFNVNVPNEIKDKVLYKSGQTQILNLDETIDFIKKVASYKLEDIKKEVLNGNENWLKIRELIKI